MPKKPKGRAKAAPKRRGTARARASRTDRLAALIKLQQRSVDHWSTYAENAAKLITKGTVSPTHWMSQYADFSKNLSDDVSDFIRIMFPAER